MRPVGTTRRSRALLLAAAVAAGVGPLRAQTGDPSVSVSAPQPVLGAPGIVSPFSVVPDAVQSAGFRTSLASTTGTVQKMPAGDAAPSPLGSPTFSAPPGAANSALGQPQMVNPGRATTVPTHTGPVYQSPMAAPAWRWHGYGGVIVTDNPSVPSARATPLPNTTPTGSAVAAMPEAGPPAFTPAVDVAPSPLPGTPQPLSVGETAWKPVGEQVGLANPMRGGPDQWIGAGGGIVTVSATTPVSRGPAVTLDAPRVAGTYVSRGVSEAMTPPAPAVRPATYVAPAPPARPAPVEVPAAIRYGIGRVAAGRGRDLDISVTGPSSLLVRLKVRQPIDAEYLANAISRMPDLAPYQVQFEMQVAR